MVFNATLNNISVIPWRSVLLMDETRVPGENYHRPVTSHWQTLSHNVVSSTLRLSGIWSLGPLWSWSYDNWIYNYICNQCLSPLILWVWIPLRRDLPNATLRDKVCQWLATGICQITIGMTGCVGHYRRQREESWWKNLILKKKIIKCQVTNLINMQLLRQIH
jgi:hypothetical protein